MMPKVWNAVMGGIFGARRHCPVCGKRMKRSIAVEEQYIRVSTERGPVGWRNVGQVQIIPVYDTCADCKQRILHKNNKLRLS